MKKIIFIVIVFVKLIEIHAQVAVNNELKEIINQSFKFFPKLKEIENTVNTAQQKLVVIRNNSPTVDANANYTFVQPKIILPFPINGKTEDFQFAPVHNVNANISASYLLFDFGRLKATIEKAKNDVKYAAHNVEAAKTQLANQISILYYNIVYYKKAIEIQDSVIGYLTTNKSIVESKLKNGEAIKLDLLSIQSQIDAEQNKKVDLENYLQKNNNLLYYTTGTSNNKNLNFDFTLVVVSAETAFADAQLNNIDYVLIKDRIKQSEEDVNLVRLDKKPSVSIGANTGYKNGYVPKVNDIRFNYAAGLVMKLPIYNGNKTKQQIKLSETLVRQNELAIETLNNSYKKDIQQALIDVASNIERINNSKSQIEQAQVAKVIASSRFKNDIGTNLEILNASTNIQRASFSKLQYEYQLCLAKVELARLIGYRYW